MLPPSSSNSSQSSIDSPISQDSPHQHAWFPSFPRRREHPKYPRFYSTPLKEDSPDSTPLQLYGLEPRAPSIAEKPRRFRFSRPLDDIKEDYTLPSHPYETTRPGYQQRQSIFIPYGHDNTLSSGAASASAPGSSASSASSVSPGAHSPVSSSGSRPPSTFYSSGTQSPPSRKLSRRFSVFSFSQRKAKYRAGAAQSISQPNLIGSSTQI